MTHEELKMLFDKVNLNFEMFRQIAETAIESMKRCNDLLKVINDIMEAEENDWERV